MRRYEYSVLCRGEWHRFASLREVRVFVKKNGADKIIRTIYTPGWGFPDWKPSSTKEIYLI